MSDVQAAFGQLGDRAAAARLVDGRLDDLLVDGPDDIPSPGAVLRATCDRPVKGQGGMFMKLGGGLTGFHRNARGLEPGQTLLVQVSGSAEAGKAVPVTDRVLFKSRFCIVTPGAPGINVARALRDEEERDRILEAAHEAFAALPEAEGLGMILRSACEGADEDEIAADIAATWDIALRVTRDAGTEPELLLDAPDAQEKAWREWADAAPSDDWAGVLDQLEAFRSPQVALGQATAFIEPTRALVAVDVNTPEGGAGGLRANIALAKELPRQLRIRGLGGQIVLDLAPMPKRDRQGVEAALRAAFKSDPVETSFIGWTPLGHVELTRRRERRPLEEMR